MCLIGYHSTHDYWLHTGWILCEALNLGSVCSRQLHGNLGPCSSQESSNSSIPFSVPEETKVLKNSSSQTARHKERSIGIQNVYSSRSKSTQTKGSSKLTNSSCQANVNDIRTPGNNLLHHLTQCSNFEKFATDLANHNQTHKFLKTIQSLIDGKMNFNNIAWKAALDMGYLSSCSSTTQMDYEFCLNFAKFSTTYLVWA